MGYGIISLNGKNARLISMGSVHLTSLSDHFLKLKRIFETTIKLIEDYKPDELAIESQFHGKNVQSMLKLGRAQGVSISAALSRSLPVFEYQPRKVKQSVTGNGNASKEQVSAMLSSLLNFDGKPVHLDATDGLAVALCHSMQRQGNSGKGESYTGWKAFLKENPGRKLS